MHIKRDISIKRRNRVCESLIHTKNIDFLCMSKLFFYFSGGIELEFPKRSYRAVLR